MNSTVKRVLLVAGVLAVLLLAYYTVFADSSEEGDNSDHLINDDVSSPDTGGGNGGNGGGGSGGGAGTSPAGFPLRQGSRGNNVRKWQDYIYTKVYGKAQEAGRQKFVDGVFGPQTEAHTSLVTGKKVVPLPAFIDAMGHPAAVTAPAPGGSGVVLS